MHLGYSCRVKQVTLNEAVFEIHFEELIRIFQLYLVQFMNSSKFWGMNFPSGPQNLIIAIFFLLLWMQLQVLSVILLFLRNAHTSF